MTTIDLNIIADRFILTSCWLAGMVALWLDEYDHAAALFAFGCFYRLTMHRHAGKTQVTINNNAPNTFVEVPDGKVVRE